ncbi:MAG: hypothetical protein ACLGPL_02610 [Acidobacteriota bacterium]
MKRIHMILAIALFVLVAGASNLFAFSGYLGSFNTQYGTSGTALNSCSLCHAGGGTTKAMNPYGADYLANGSFTAIESIDSDGDGATNITEINARTLPGDASSVPSVPTTTPLFRDTFATATATGSAKWTSVMGTWQGNGATFWPLETTNAIATVKNAKVNPFSAGRLESNVKLTNTFTGSANGAIVFGFVSKTQYRYVKLTATKVIIGQVGSINGVAAGVKASVNKTIPINTLQKVTVDIYSTGDVKVYLNKAATATATYTFASPVAGRVGYATTTAKTVFDNFTAWDESVLP